MLIISLILIIIIIGGIAGIYYIMAFNRLNDLKTKVNEAESIIDENLRIKYDTLIRVSNKLKKHLKTDKNYFKEYEKLNTMNLSNFDMDRKLNEGLTIILKMRDDLGLETENDLNKDLENIRQIDEKLCATKNYYNKNTSLLNGLIRRFPTNLIAKIHKFKVKLFFDGKDMDDEIIDDFKI